jgi:peptide-methionine (S)-S-oxide reductase
VFFTVAHDPTQLNRQGPDAGTQYRSAIFYANDEQQRAARAMVDSLAHAGTWPAPIVTQIVPLHGFFAAEGYHQDYAILHPMDPYIFINDRPKVGRLRERWPGLYRDDPVRAVATR